MDSNTKKKNIILTEEEAAIAAETILNAWLKEDDSIVLKDKAYENK